MKQKNLILLVVAVGCGLLAAFLTTQMKAGPASVDTQEIYVAAKELMVGTKLEKDKLGELVKKKKVPKADVQLDAILNEDELIGKEINQPRRENDAITVKDVTSTNIRLVPPEGKHLYTIKLPYEAVVGPFVQPGSKVDVVCTIKPPGTTEIRHIKLLPEVLVMAVDQANQVTGEKSRAVLNTLTLAASLNESQWLHTAQEAGASLRFLVRDEKSETFAKLPDDVLIKLFNKPSMDDKVAGGISEGEKKPVNTETPEAPKAPPIKIPVLVADVKAGTTIDDDFIEKQMLKTPFAAPAPADAILDLSAHKGRVIAQDLPAKSYLTAAVLGDKPKAGETKVETPKVETPKVEVKKPFKTWETSITTGSGTKKYRYVMYDKDGDWVLVGEVHEDGTVTTAPLPSIQPKPDATKGDATEGGKISQP